MKKLAIIVSILCAFLVTALGIKSVSAKEYPTYCVVVASDFGFSDHDYIVGLLAERVEGHMVDPSLVDDAFKQVGMTEGRELSAEQAQALGQLVQADYVITLHAYDNMLYDDILHNVDCGIEVVNTATGDENTYMGNILVAKKNNPKDENHDALRQFIQYTDNIVLK